MTIGILCREHERVSSKCLEEARKCFGTDEDLLLVINFVISQSLFYQVLPSFLFYIIILCTWYRNCDDLPVKFIYTHTQGNLNRLPSIKQLGVKEEN